ncbi:MAG: DUF5320 domain-containing protein [Firmicutes bacterium]|nr:DUF5320 domain-containing protein [Bacillota bacterium]
MPGGDRTGPVGAGPRTGRAAGLCAGYGVPGYANPGVWCGGRRPGWGLGRGPGRGFGPGWAPGRGRGRGLGLAWRWGPGAVAYEGYSDELEELRRRLDALEARLGGRHDDAAPEEDGGGDE